MSGKQFAPDVPRNEQGWILFPQRDSEWRKQLFPPEVSRHIAKANMHLIQALVEYLTEPGDTILDPFGGTGTLLIARLMGRNVSLIELEPAFLGIIRDTTDKWWMNKPGLITGDTYGNVTLRPGDCRLVMPQFCDHAIFSPPYAQAMGKAGKKFTEYEDDKLYRGSMLNLGRLNPYLYTESMDTVYKLLGQSVPPGGFVAVIIKDQMRGDSRIHLSEGATRSATRAGFELFEWHKWLPPGSSYQAIHKSQGHNVVPDEDILIYRKPLL